MAFLLITVLSNDSHFNLKRLFPERLYNKYHVFGSLPMTSTGIATSWRSARVAIYSHLAQFNITCIIGP